MMAYLTGTLLKRHIKSVGTSHYSLLSSNNIILAGQEVTPDVSGMRPDNPGGQPAASGQDASSDKPVQGPQPASSGVSQRDGGGTNNNGKNDEGNSRDENDNKEAGQRRSIISSIR